MLWIITKTQSGWHKKIELNVLKQESILLVSSRRLVIVVIVAVRGSRRLEGPLKFQLLIFSEHNDVDRFDNLSLQ